MSAATIYFMFVLQVTQKILVHATKPVSFDSLLNLSKAKQEKNKWKGNYASILLKNKELVMPVLISANEASLLEHVIY